MITSLSCTEFIAKK